MNKKIVALFAGYNASEKTLCALYLAENILKRYKYIVWVVPDDVRAGSKYFGFSHKWDTEVLSLKSKESEIKKRLCHCEMCIFFEESEQLYSMLPAGTKTAVFLDPYQWTYRQSKGFAQKCTYVLSSSPAVTKKIVQPNLLTHDILCPFDHSLQMLPQVHFPPGEKATLFYPAYGMSFSERIGLLRIADIVKTCCPQIKSVVAYYDATDTSEAGKDSRTYDWKLLNYLKQADWIIDLNPRPLLGLFASFAGALGIPWAGFILPPNTDEYHAARRHLVPYPKGGLTIQNAEEIAGTLVEHLMRSNRNEVERNKGAGAYANRLNEFTRAMNKLFDKKSR